MPCPAESRPPDAPAQVSDFDRRVYRAITAYAWDEAESWPSQDTIASEVGCTRESVNRAIRRLIAAEWLRIKEKRRSARSGWDHNVYELLADFVTGAPTIKRIVSRAHNTPKKRARRLAERADHTNRKYGPNGQSGWCGCGWCKPDRPSVRRPPPPVRPKSRQEKSLERFEQRIREKYGEEFLRRVLKQPGLVLEW